MLAAPREVSAAELDALAAADEAQPAAEVAPEVAAVASPDSGEDRSDTAQASSPPAVTPPNGQSVSWPQGVNASPADIADYEIGSVAGRKIPLSDLVAKWIWREPARVRAILDDIVLSRIIVFEAAALQIELPDGAIKASVEARLERLEAESKAAGSPSLEAYIQESLGMEPSVFMKYAQEEAAIDLLAPRCVRSWLLASDHREIRAITVTTKEEVDQVQARLAQGEPFANIASELSIDPSKDDGGRLPPVVRGGDMVLTRTAFAAEVGEVSGPIKDRDELLFVLVEKAPKPLEGLWPDIGEQVEASLDARDIEDPEFWQWKAQMLGRYDVNMDPFLDLVK
jgi:parvulin-like peptidyl-prolyl isomerase